MTAGRHEQGAPANLLYQHALKASAYLVSIVFHPLFIPLYATWYIAFVHPVFFTGINEGIKYWILIRVFINMVLFQTVAVLLLKGVGFIDSVLLKTPKDRIIPYITAGIFYFWMYLVFHNQPAVPLIMSAFTFAAFLSSYAALLANIYIKVSMHAIGMGGLIGLLLVVLFWTHSAIAIPLPLMLIILATGMVCTSRMLISDHTQREIYTGLLIGIISQLIGAWWALS